MEPLMELVQIFSILFFILLFLKTGFELYLNWRNQEYVRAHGSSVPAPFEGKITPAEHKKAADYTVEKSKLSRFNLIFGLVSLIIWLPCGLLNSLDQYVTSNFDTEITRGLALFFIFSMINLIISLPVDYYSTFVLEEKFGFNKTDKKTFFTDLVKKVLLSIVIALPFLYVLLKIVLSLGQMWWFYAWSFLIGFQFLMIMIYPNFIAPLFNKFSTIEDGELKSKILALLEKTGFQSNGLFIMDASKRSSHGNAYFTGFGKTKRIVFFDNLIKSLEPNEVEAVLAHELGHFKHKHIFKMLTVSILGALIGFAILGYLYESNTFFTGHFIEQRSSYMALLLFSLVSPLYTFFLTPIFSILSRKHEYEADAFAAKYSQAKDLISALVNLYKENASTLTPDPLFSKIYHSHPPALERIKHLESL